MLTKSTGTRTRYVRQSSPKSLVKSLFQFSVAYHESASAFSVVKIFSAGMLIWTLADTARLGGVNYQKSCKIPVRNVSGLASFEQWLFVMAQGGLMEVGTRGDSTPWWVNYLEGHSRTQHALVEYMRHSRTQHVLVG
jgi:hypothetical protein